MGSAVQESIQSAIATQKGITVDAAGEIVAGLRRDKRLHKDLY